VSFIIIFGTLSFPIALVLLRDTVRRTAPIKNSFVHFSDVVTGVSGGYEPATSTSEEPIATRKVQDNVKNVQSRPKS